MAQENVFSKFRNRIANVALAITLGLTDEMTEDEVSGLDRVAEQRDAPVHAEQKCPACDGIGAMKFLWLTLHCSTCHGTGISTRSAGG